MIMTCNQRLLNVTKDYDCNKRFCVETKDYQFKVKIIIFNKCLWVVNKDYDY